MPKATAPKPKTKRERNVVAVCLQPEEAEAFLACAEAESRTISNFVRLAALRGLAEYKRDPRALIDFKTA